MKILEARPEDLLLSPELVRSRSAKPFEDRLRSSIDAIGLVEPIKVAADPSGGFLVIDGNLRFRAIQSIREKDPARFETVPVYLLDYEQRYEIRYQSDIYQDLLPSQLATLVEHLHKSESVLKSEIARFIGVSPSTLRNYTGLWRLLDRGGLFASLVELMDVGVFPASNPYAWLRLTDYGLARVLTEEFAKGENLEDWIAGAADVARQRRVQRYELKYIEAVTAALPANCYRVGEEARAIKRDLGLRRSTHSASVREYREARAHLRSVARASREAVLVSAAESLQEYLA